MSKAKKSETKQLALRIAKKLKEDVYDLRGRIAEKRLAAAIEQALIKTAIPDEAADLRVQQLKEAFDRDLENKVWSRTQEARQLKHNADMLKMEYEKKLRSLDDQQERDKKTAEAVRTLMEVFHETQHKASPFKGHIFATTGYPR